MENLNSLSPIQNERMTCYGGVAAAAALPSPPPTTLTTLPSSPCNTFVRVREVGSGGAEDPNTVVKQSVDGFKWRLLVSYDGTHFKGWQFQQTPPTIQCILEKALTRATKLERKDLHLVGASRTDGGVHAWGQLSTVYFLLTFVLEKLVLQFLSSMLDFLPRERFITTRYIMMLSWIHFSVCMHTMLLINSMLL
ncbi:TRNA PSEUDOURIDINE SYNTHASE-LIKE 1 [Salix purpurea]|uniref:tRNA pseudouridine synthase n=1 Tax=Salix purpurea TaxID=77065 RepID=A0A9Q0U8Q8_SALPP|nr:TRNA PSEUDOURIDINE SYNTHASE-LIKE 1 [Salix purpurea]